jgi:hypothetical protein
VGLLPKDAAGGKMVPAAASPAPATWRVVGGSEERCGA